MVRVISQDAFEAAVHENMADFDMTQEEAIKDTIEQFQAQGVELSNIIKDLILSDPTKQHPITKCVDNLKNTFKMHSAQLEEDLNALKLECDKDLAHKLMANKEGVYNILINIITSFQENPSVCLAALKCMVSLMDGQPDILQKEDTLLFNKLLDNQNDNDIIVETLRWVSNCCIKHENNRQIIFKANILYHLKSMLENHKNPTILIEVCSVIRHLILDDDVRVEYGQAHEHARLIASDILHLLTQMLKEFESNQDFVSEILLTLSTLVVRHEFCQKIDDAGGLQFIFDVMIEFYENEKINRHCFKLLKALAGNDDVKRNIIKKGGATLLYSALDRHKSALQSARFGLACISAVALRDAENSQALFEAGLCDVIIQCMLIHENNVSVIRNASWAIRNMSIRCPENRSKFIELRAEEILNKAKNKFDKDVCQDIKAALRDLGCDVKFDEQWTGKGGKIHTSADAAFDA